MSMRLGSRVSLGSSENSAEQLALSMCGTHGFECRGFREAASGREIRSDD